MFKFINGSGVGYDWLWQNITFLGDGLPAFVLLVFFSRRYPKILWFALVITVFVGIGVQAAKNIMDLMRPAAVLGVENIHVIGQVLRTHSFPSGHSATALSLAALLNYFLPKKYTYLLLLCAVIVAWSRVVVGAHWPVDVIVGSIFGWYGTHLSILVAERCKWNFSSRYFIYTM
ncbi:MAG: phosphatase PAP2 family protein, partial [Gammaproteobacteria bacterium]|nr:phosphatase PAP2 family protein [Gammaproteobacteria bacterium]